MVHDHKPPIPTEDDTPFAGYTTVPRAGRSSGWTAKRQGEVLTSLADTGSITFALSDADISPHSAYRLRARRDAVAFAKARDYAPTPIPYELP